MKFVNIFVLMLLTVGSFFVSAEITWNPSTAIDLSEPGRVANFSQIAVSSRKGIAVWHRNSVSGYMVQTKYTDDCGKSWSVPTTGIDLSDPGAFNPRVAMSDQKGIVVWYGHDGLHYIIQTKYTVDGGKIWYVPTTGVFLSDTGENAFGPQIAMSDQNGIAIWYRNNGSLYIIQTKYTVDGGRSWSIPTSGTNLSDSVANAKDPQIAMSGQNGIAVWCGFSGSDNIIQTKYTVDGGKSWSVPTTGTNLSDSGAFDPQIAINGQNGIAVWYRNNGSFDIIQTKYTVDGGISWSVPTTGIDVSDTGHSAVYPQVAMSGQNGILIWNRYDGSKYVNQVKYTIDGGRSWSVPTTGIDISDTGQSANGPQVAISGQNGIAVWNRDGSSKYIIQTKYTFDGGKSWSVPTTGIDLSMPIDFVPGDVPSPQIGISGRNAIAVWDAFQGAGNNIIQTKYTTVPPLPPTYASGKKLINKFAVQTYYYNVLTWSASPSIGVTGYAIYRDSAPQPIATVSATTFSYTDKPVSKKSTHVYTVKSVDSSLSQESVGYTFTVK